MWMKVLKNIFDILYNLEKIVAKYDFWLKKLRKRRKSARYSS